MLASMKPEPGADMLRILIVDDSHHFLAAARSVLEQGGISVVGMASTKAEALELAGELRPDGILVDIDLGDESGLDLAREFARLESAPVVLISAYPASELADLIATSPVSGFLPKSDLSASAVRRLISTEVGPG